MSIICGMTGNIEYLILAVTTLVASHFILSSIPVRTALIGRIGDGPFKAIYSLVALASLVWIVFAYKAAPVRVLWEPPEQLSGLVMPIMLLACIFCVAGQTTRSPTQIDLAGGSGAGLADFKPAQGIQSITRHPFLWAVVLWAVAHLLVNGDMSTIILMTGMIILALGGMRHIDFRRQKMSGSAWGPVALSTSLIPFLAIFQGRCKLDLKGIGFLRVLGGLLLYTALLLAHGWAGVALVDF